MFSQAEIPANIARDYRGTLYLVACIYANTTAGTSRAATAAG